MALENNKWEQRYNDIKINYGGVLSSATTTAAAWGGIGNSIFGAPGAALASIAGFFTGLFTGGMNANRELEQAQQQVINSAKDTLGSLETTVGESIDNWTYYIEKAQGVVNTTRANIDSLYGEGTYDIFDSLFTTIFNMKDGSSLSDVFENATVEKYSELSGLASGTNEAMSLTDISAGYQEYLKSMIMNADGRFALNTERENTLVKNYLYDVEQYRLDMASQFADAFLQKFESDVSAQQAIGQTQVAQASSGLRQTGGGTALTIYQQFQNDLADIAYASSINYLISKYQIVLKSSEISLISSINEIRSENAMSASQLLQNAINAYNDANKGLSDYYHGVTTEEGTIEEAESQRDEITEFLDEHDESYESWTLEDYF